MGDAVLTGQPEHLARVPARLHHDAPTRQQADPDPVEVAERVPDRQPGVEHVVIAEFLAFGGRSHRKHGRVVGVQDALGLAAAARGERQVGHRIGGGRAGQMPGRRVTGADDSLVAGDRQAGRRRRGTVPGHDQRAAPALLREDGQQRLRGPVPAEGRDGHHHPRLGKAEDPVQVTGAERRHDVRHDRADPFRGQEGGHKLADRRQCQQHDVSR